MSVVEVGLKVRYAAGNAVGTEKVRLLDVFYNNNISASLTAFIF
jgi:hypothetical protein